MSLGFLGADALGPLYPGLQLLFGRLRQIGHASLDVAQQPAIAGPGHGLFLHRGVDDHALEFGGLDRVHVHRRLDGLGQQLFHASLARQARLVVRHAAEVLPDDVLAPAIGHGFIAQVVGVLEIQQRDHQASNHPPAEPGAFDHEPLKAATSGLAVGASR